MKINLPMQQLFQKIFLLLSAESLVDESVKVYLAVQPVLQHLPDRLPDPGHRELVYSDIDVFLLFGINKWVRPRHRKLGATMVQVSHTFGKVLHTIMSPENT